MIGDIIEIFKARKNPALATKLGARFATGAAIERLGWPLAIAKFWMALAGLICSVIICGLLYLTFTVAQGFIWPALLPAGLLYVIFRIWTGIDKGLDRVKLAAQTYTDSGIDRIGTKITARRGRPDEAESDLT